VPPSRKCRTSGHPLRLLPTHQDNVAAQDNLAAGRGRQWAALDRAQRWTVGRHVAPESHLRQSHQPRQRRTGADSSRRRQPIFDAHSGLSAGVLVVDPSLDGEDRT
jgi:hypothetical protein